MNVMMVQWLLKEKCTALYYKGNIDRIFVRQINNYLIAE